MICQKNGEKGKATGLIREAAAQNLLTLHVLRNRFHFKHWANGVKVQSRTDEELKKIHRAYELFMCPIDVW